MTLFCDLPALYQLVLITFLYAAIHCELTLILYQNTYTDKYSRRLPEIFVLVGLICLLILLVKCYQGLAGVFCFDRIPTPFLVVLICVVFFRTASEMIQLYRYRKTALSPQSIKQAIDDLPTGVFFADSEGRIILCNHKMSELAITLIGRHPQVAREMEEALEHPAAGISRLKGDPVLYCFPDGSVWRFRTVSLCEQEFHGFTQTIAQNVTELYQGNAQLQADNEEMKRINAQLHRMYERIADRIREQENLELKMRIHNNIGVSLIAIEEIMHGDSDADVDKQLAALKNAVSYFSDDRPALRNTFDEVRQNAAKMKVDLVLDGYIPQNAVIEGLIVAAARECVTNCVKYANGNRVVVEIREHFDVYTVTITNNGEPPKEKITEGGGLSNLRRSVEAAGGEMYLSHKPVFALILNLPGKELEL